MTTIVWDGKTLASDGRITTATYIMRDDCCKLFTLDNVQYKCSGIDDTLIAMGMCGNTWHWQTVVSYLRGDGTVDEIGDLEFGAILIGQRNVYEIADDCDEVISYPLHHKFAIGSGTLIARSAFELGLNSRQTIAHTMKFDSATGGLIFAMDIINGKIKAFDDYGLSL